MYMQLSPPVELNKEEEEEEEEEEEDDDEFEMTITVSAPEKVGKQLICTYVHI